MPQQGAKGCRSRSIRESQPAKTIQASKTSLQEKVKTERLAGRLTAVRFFSGNLFCFRGKQVSHGNKTKAVSCLFYSNVYSMLIMLNFCLPVGYIGNKSIACLGTRAKLRLLRNVLRTSICRLDVKKFPVKQETFLAACLVKLRQARASMPSFLTALRSDFLAAIRTGGKKQTRKP